MWSSLIGAIGIALASFVGRALIALGLGYATYTGFQALGTYGLGQIKDAFGGMGADAAGLLGYLWVDKAISVIFSAYTSALALKMAGSTSVTKLVHK